VNHQVWPVLRGVAGNLEKWPLVDVVAILNALVLDAAAGVPDHDDAFGVWLGERQNPPIDRGRRCAGWDGRLTYHPQASGRRQSRRHRHTLPIGNQCRAVGYGSDHNARDRLPALT